MENYILAPYVTAGIQDHILYIGFGSIQFKITDSAKFKTCLEVMLDCKNPTNENKLFNKYQNDSLALEMLRQLKQHQMLIPVASYDSKDRWSRQNLYFHMSGVDANNIQQRLSDKTVAVLGCGGIGNQISVHLATAGVQRFILCDADRIEASNLSRQILFTENDIGQSKTQTLAKALRQRLSNIEIECVETNVLNTDHLSFCLHADFVIVSADKGDVVNVVNKFCVENQIPYLNVGYVNDISVWGPLYIPNESGCYSCQSIVANDYNPDLHDLLKTINRDYQAPSVGPVNMISSGLASRDILMFLAGAKDKVHSLNKRIGLWTHNLKFEEQSCHQNPDCKVCGA